MGKYMRKCRGPAVGEEVTQQQAVGGGVRTRSRAAKVLVVSKRIRKPLPPSPLRRAAAGDASVGGEGESGSCYLKLRSRMLFMAPTPPMSSTPASASHRAEATDHAPAGLSRCDSTASSVDASSSAEAHDRTSTPCRSDAAEAGSDNIRREGSASDDDSGRERRETTPSSHRLPGELSDDLELDLGGQSGSRSLPSALTTDQAQAAARVRMPAAAEIDEFFAAAEEAEAKRFASKYNFDVARGVPLDSGRFEWVPAVSSS